MKHRIQMRAAASALAACICLSVLPGALAAEPGRVKAPGRTEMEHGPVSTEFASTRLAFAVSDPVTNADDTVTLDVAYADSQGTKHERVTPTGMTETDVALITVADNPVAAGSTIELCYNEHRLFRYHEVRCRALPGERRTRRHAGHRLAHRQVGQSDHRGRPGSL